MICGFLRDSPKAFIMFLSALTCSSLIASHSDLLTDRGQQDNSLKRKSKKDTLVFEFQSFAC